jgi:D-alanine-D-alanine ligase
MGNSDDLQLLALPPVEILTGKSEFFDYQTKYFSGETQEICPADISPELAQEILDISKKVHVILGCDGLTRSDFILRDGVLYFLEINTIPGQTEVSLSPKAAKVAGLSFADFLDKQIEMALKKWQ